MKNAQIIEDHFVRFILLISLFLSYSAVANVATSTAEVSSSNNTSKLEYRHNIKLRAANDFGIHYEYGFSDQLSLQAGLGSSFIRSGRGETIADLALITLGLNYSFVQTFQDGFVVGATLSRAKISETKENRILSIRGESYEAAYQFFLIGSSLTYNWYSNRNGLNAAIGTQYSYSQISQSDFDLFLSLGYLFK